MKNVILIRHGQSLGQTAWDNGMSRKDKRLVDCFLSNRGVREAHGLRSNGTLQRCTFDLVLTSPLTRAVATCVLALGHITEREMKNSAGGVATTPFLAHPCISEAGTIPENTGREIPVLKKDLKKKLSLVCPSSSDCIDHIDFSLVPNSWPLVDDSGKSEKKGNWIFS